MNTTTPTHRSGLTVHVNDEPREVPEGTTCRDLVASVTGRDIGGDGRPTTAADGPGDPRPAAGLGVAVALDGAVVPRAAWARTLLADGARVELVTAVQGG